MSAASDFAAASRLPPQRALQWLAGRARLTPTFSWQDLWQDEHARQFTVSRLTRLDILRSMQEGITASVNGNLTRRDWLRDMQALLKREGWWGEREVVDPATGEILSTLFDSPRLKLIFDTNTRQAYAAGQWQHIEEAKATHPYIRYITKADDRVRDEHAAWDGVTLPVDDAFWNTHTPPCGYRCRCRITTMTQVAYDKRKGEGSIKTTAPTEREIEHINKKTGEHTRVPVGVHPAFAYNPGKAALRDISQGRMIGAKIAAAPAPLGAAVAKTFPSAQIGAGFDKFFDQAIAERTRPQGRMMVVGALQPTWVAAATRAGVAPVSAEIAVLDRNISHTFRSAKVSPLPMAWYRDLPTHLKTPRAVLLDTADARHPAFLLIYDDVGDARKKLVVRINYKLKRGGVMNVVESGKVLDVADLKAGIGHGYELVEGSL